MKLCKQHLATFVLGLLCITALFGFVVNKSPQPNAGIIDPIRFPNDSVADLTGSTKTTPDVMYRTTFELNPEPATQFDYPFRVQHIHGYHYFSEYADWGNALLYTSSRFGYQEYAEDYDGFYWYGDLYDDIDPIDTDGINNALGVQSNNNYTLFFDDAYDTNVDLLYNVTDEGNVKQWFVINEAPPQPASWLEGNISLSFASSYDVNASLLMMVDGSIQSRTADYMTNSNVWFMEDLIYDGEDKIIYEFAQPFGYDSAGNTTTGTLRLTYSGGNAYVEKLFPLAWINATERVFPLFLDASVLIDGTAAAHYWPQVISSADSSGYKIKSCVLLVDSDQSLDFWYSTTGPSSGWTSTTVDSGTGVTLRRNSWVFHDTANDNLLAAGPILVTGDTKYDIEVFTSSDRGASWSYLSSIVTDSDNDLALSNFAMDDWGFIYLAWGLADDTIDPDVFMSYSADGGATWSLTGDSTVYARSTADGDVQFQPKLGYNPTEEKIYLIAQQTRTKMSYYEAGDTGLHDDPFGDSWNSPVLIDTASNWIEVGSPIIWSAIDTDEGVISYSGEVDGTGIAYRKPHTIVTQDGGATWGNKVSPATYGANYRLPPGGVFTGGVAGDIVHLYSQSDKAMHTNIWDVSGNSWSGETQIEATTDTGYERGFGGSDTNGYMLMAYEDYQTDDEYIYYHQDVTYTHGSPDIHDISIDGVADGSQLYAGVPYIIEVATISDDLISTHHTFAKLKWWSGDSAEVYYEAQYSSGSWTETSNGEYFYLDDPSSSTDDTNGIRTFSFNITFHSNMSDTTDFDFSAMCFDNTDKGYSHGGTQTWSAWWARDRSNDFDLKTTFIPTLVDSETFIIGFNDTDNWYAEHTWYWIQANATVPEGYDFLDSILLEIRLTTTRYLALKYDDDVGWTEDYGGTDWNYRNEAVTEGGSASSGEGYWLVEVEIQILWTFDSPSDSQQDFEYWVNVSTASNSDSDYDNDVVDIITGVDVLVGTYGGDQDPNTYWVATGHVEYYNGSTYVLTNDYDIDVQYNWNGGGTYSDTNLPLGNWLVTGTVGNFTGIWWINATVTGAPSGMGFTLSANSSVIIVISASTPTTVLGDGVSGVWMQGESISYDIEIPDKISDADGLFIVSSDGAIQWNNLQWESLADDGNEWTLGCVSPDDGTGRMTITGYWNTPYHDVNSIWWDINPEGTSSGGGNYAYFSNNDGSDYYQLITEQVADSLAINDTFVINDRVYFYLRTAAASAVVGTSYTLDIDQWAISFNNVTGSVRSQHYIVDPTNTLHKIVIQSFDYGVSIQLDHPSDWTFASANPTASVTTSSGRTVLTNTIPTTYEIYYTSNSSLRLGHAAEIWNEGFEATGDEYITVFEGATSYTLTSELLVDPPTTATYYVVWSHYIDSGVLYLNGTEYTTLDQWVTNWLYFNDLDVLNFTATDAYIDNIRIYQAQLTASNPTSGMLKYLTPYGLYDYQYDTIQGLIYDSTNTLIENDTLSTNGIGIWSNSFSSFTSAGTYTLHLWHYVNDFAITVQQLGFSGVTLASYSDTDKILQVTSETYSDQRYNVSIDGIWVATNIANNALVAINATSGSHSYEVYAVDRDTTSPYLIFLDSTVGSGSYTTLTLGDMRIVFYDQQGVPIDFNVLDVFVNDTQIYVDIYAGYEEYDYNVTALDRWDNQLSTGVYDWTSRLEIQLTIYSFKVYSYNYDFIYYNLTQSGSTQFWSEYIAPLEVVEYRLYAGTYDWEIFMTNGSSFTGQLTIPDPTYGDYAQIITDDTANDIFNIMNVSYLTVLSVNVTSNNIYDESLIIQLMFDWTNTTIYNQTVTIEAMFDWDNTTLYNQTITIANAFNSTNTVIYQQTIDILTNITNINSTVHSQLVYLLANVSNTNSTIYSQTVSILADLQNVNTTLYVQTIDILANVTNVNSTIYTQTLTILSDIQNVNTTLYAQTVTLLANLQNVNSTIYDQTVQLLSNITNVNSTIYTQTVTILSSIENVNSTLYTQSVDILSSVLNNNSLIYDQTVYLLSNMTNINSTLYTQTVSILSEIDNVNSSIFTQTVDILSDISNVNSTIYSQTVDILSSVLNNNSLIYDQTVYLLSNITNINSTLYTQTVSILSEIDNVNSSIFTQTVNILSNITNVNTTLYGQTVTILSDLQNINSTLYTQTVNLLSNITNVNSTIYTQTLTILSNIDNMNSTLYTQAVNILSNVTNTNSTLYTQTVSILSEISNINSSIFGQTVYILNNLTNVNSTLYTQGVDIINYVINANNTIGNQTVTFLNAFVGVYGYSNAPFHLVLENTEILDNIYASLVTNWGNATVLLYDNDTLVGSIQNEGTFIQWTKDETVGLHELGFKINSSGSTLWVNTSYTITVGLSLDFWADPTFTSAGTYIGILTNWGNTTIYMYDNDVLKGSASEDLNIEFPYDATIGTHPIGFYIDGGTSAFWINDSYTIAASGANTGIMEIRVFDETGQFIAFRNFIVYTNYTGTWARLYSDIFELSDRAYTVNVTVYDVFSREVNSTVFDYGRTVDVFVDVSSVLIQNLDSYPVHVNWTYNGGSISNWIPGDGNYENYQLYSGDYNLTIYYSNLRINNFTAYYNGTSVLYELTITAGEDVMFVVNGTMLADILTNLQNNNVSVIRGLVVEIGTNVTTISGTLDDMEEVIIDIETNTLSGSSTGPPEALPTVQELINTVGGWLLAVFGMVLAASEFSKRKSAERRSKRGNSVLRRGIT